MSGFSILAGPEAVWFTARPAASSSCASRPGEAEREEITLTSRPGEAEREEITLASRPAEAEREEIILASRPGEAEREEITLASRPGEAEREETTLASRPGEAEREEITLTSRPGETEREEITLTSRPGETEREAIEQNVAFVDITGASSETKGTRDSVGARLHEEKGAVGLVRAIFSNVAGPLARRPAGKIDLPASILRRKTAGYAQVHWLGHERATTSDREASCPRPRLSSALRRAHGVRDEKPAPARGAAWRSGGPDP